MLGTNPTIDSFLLFKLILLNLIKTRFNKLTFIIIFSSFKFFIWKSKIKKLKKIGQLKKFQKYLYLMSKPPPKFWKFWLFGGLEKGSCSSPNQNL